MHDFQKGDIASVIILHIFGRGDAVEQRPLQLTQNESYEKATGFTGFLRPSFRFL